MCNSQLKQTKVEMIAARYSLSSIYYSNCNQFGVSADLTCAYISNSVSGGQLDSLTHWKAWYEANLLLLHSKIDIDTIWNNSPSAFNMKGLKILKMNIWTINFMLRQPTTKRVLWEIYRGASSTNLHPIFNKTTKKPHHYFEHIFKFNIFWVSALRRIQLPTKQPRNH